MPLLRSGFAESTFTGRNGNGIPVGVRAELAVLYFRRANVARRESESIFVWLYR